MSYQDLKGLAQTVGIVMEGNSAARNNDNALAWLVWTKHEGLDWNCSGKTLIAKLHEKKLSQFESIIRCRRKIQEQGLYPADAATKLQRKRCESRVRGQVNMWG